jgi:ribosomal-protein-alanine acetyltransferase
VNRKKIEPAHEIANEETSGISGADFSFYIRRATIEDCQAIVGLEQECFSVPWSEKSINDDLANNSKAYYYVAIASNTAKKETGTITNNDATTDTGAIKNNFTATDTGAFANNVTTTDNVVIGYIGMWLVVDDAQITNVAVSLKYRRQGVANALLRYLCDDAKSMGAIMISLEVSDANAPAISLYENEGFQKAGLRKKYYEKVGQDAIIMLKNIEQ